MNEFESYVSSELRKATAQFKVPESLLEELVQKFVYSEIEDSYSWSGNSRPPELTWRDSFGFFAWGLHSSIV